jgi:hypothetical protein
MPITFTSTWQSERTAIECASRMYESLKRLRPSPLREQPHRPGRRPLMSAIMAAAPMPIAAQPNPKLPPADRIAAFVTTPRRGCRSRCPSRSRSPSP